ncbi:MAG: MFS transporter [Rhodospirillaceae bacterium]
MMRWVILAACVTSRSGIGLQFIALAALMPQVRHDLHFNYTEVGWLLGLFMVVGVFLSVPAGMIAQRLGDRATLFLGLAALLAAATAAAWAGGFASMLASRVLGGLGAVLTTVTAAKILTDWFGGREISTAMGFLGLSWPIGIALGLSLLPVLEFAWGWRWAVQATAALPVIAVIVAGLIPMLGRPQSGSPVSEAAPTLWSITRPELMAILAGGIAWLLMSSGGYVVFSSYAADLIAAKGFTRAEAGLALGALSWLFMVTIPMGGWMADRWGRGDAQFWAGCLLSALTIALVPAAAEWRGPVLIWVLLTAVMGITVGPIMALPSQILRPAGRATGLGVFYAVYYGGTVVLPAAAGWLLDRTGSAAWVVWFAAGCLVAAPLFLMACRALQRRWGLGS